MVVGACRRKQRPGAANGIGLDSARHLGAHLERCQLNEVAPAGR